MTTREFFEKYAPDLMRDSYTFKTELLTCADRGFQENGPQGLVDALRRRGFMGTALKIKESYNKVQAARDPGEPVCDCGGRIAKTTHAHGCPARYA